MKPYYLTYENRYQAAYKAGMPLWGHTSPQIKTVSHNGAEAEVNMPHIPARSRSKSGYLREMAQAGFVVEDFVEMPVNKQNPY